MLIALIARFTGWPESFIYWDLPLARAHAYAHAFMRMNNIKTQWAEKNDMAAIMKEIDAL